MEEYIEYFTNYVSSHYDMNNKLILSKLYHSMRVAKLMLLLSQELKLNQEDTLLAFKIGLCHDLGRFREVERSGKFNNLTFDHGAYSNKILYNDGVIKYFDIQEEDSLLFKKAIYYHNKKDLPDNLGKRENLFCNMIRDMDKLDLLKVRCGKKRLGFNVLPTQTVLDNYLNSETIYLKDLQSKGNTDSVILYLSFIKDLYFDESYHIGLSNGYLDDLINIIDVDIKMETLFKELIKKIDERGKGYVRKKV